MKLLRGLPLRFNSLTRRPRKSIEAAEEFDVRMLTKALELSKHFEKQINPEQHTLLETTRTILSAIELSHPKKVNTI
jgi:hypothetical protein